METEKEERIRDLAYRHMERILGKKKLTSKQLRKLERLSKIVFDVNLYEFNRFQNYLQSRSALPGRRAGSSVQPTKENSTDSCAGSK